MPPSTRDWIITGIKARHRSIEDQTSALITTDIIDKIPADEWKAMHAVTCLTCGSPDGRLYPGGGFCDTHKPSIWTKS